MQRMGQFVPIAALVYCGLIDRARMCEGKNGEKCHAWFPKEWHEV